MKSKMMNIKSLRLTPFLISAIFLTIFTTLSCKRLPKPEFIFSPEENAETGDTIWFLNESRHADSFEWEFGDGGISNSDNPTYIYSEAGIFEVKLTAYNESGKEHTSLPITINEPTILSFIAFDSIGNMPLPGTWVWIYDNEADRDSLNTPLFSNITDNEGNVEFTNVDPLIYHVWAFKEEIGGRWEYRGYTSNLNPNVLNRFIIPCYWVSSEQATGHLPGELHQ